MQVRGLRAGGEVLVLVRGTGRSASSRLRPVASFDLVSGPVEQHPVLPVCSGRRVTVNLWGLIRDAIPKPAPYRCVTFPLIPLLMSIVKVFLHQYLPVYYHPLIYGKMQRQGQGDRHGTGTKVP